MKNERWSLPTSLILDKHMLSIGSNFFIISWTAWSRSCKEVHYSTSRSSRSIYYLYIRLLFGKIKKKYIDALACKVSSQLIDVQKIITGFAQDITRFNHKKHTACDEQNIRTATMVKLRNFSPMIIN